MNYNFLSSVLRSPWQVDSNTFTQYYPILRGVFNGLVMGDGEEPEASVPYRLPVRDGQPSKTQASGSGFVQVIPVRGVMLKHDTECGPKGMRTVGQRLLSLEKAHDIVGSILLFESGGGQAVAVPEITDAIKACTKPVVAFVDGLACSAAMYAASYCREIIASRDTDIVGSIGTMIAIEDFEKFSKDNGMVHVRIYADGAGDKNGEFENALAGNFSLIKERILNPFNEQFKADIRANRPKVEAEHLTGKTWQAREVMGILVDAVGSVSFAVSRVYDLSRQEQKLNSILNMNKFSFLMKALGVEELAAVDGSSSLTEEQLTAIETALSAAEAARVKAEKDLQTANLRIAVLEKELEKKPGAEPAGELDTEMQSGPKGEETFFGRFSRLENEFNS